MVVERDQYRLGLQLLQNGSVAAAGAIGFVVVAKNAGTHVTSTEYTLALLCALLFAAIGLLSVAKTIPKYHDSGPAFVIDLEGVTVFYTGLKFLSKAEIRKFPWNSMSEFAVQTIRFKGIKTTYLFLQSHSGKKHTEELGLVKPTHQEVMACLIEHVEKAGFTTKPKPGALGNSKTHLLVEKASVAEPEQQE
ncbi:hypothetical protein [Dinoroseobacter sp. S76]|uniref:hypothetical protein n=1 Tax=Dinoroseobacter sp. S76 TaxID=3415124 RepID=UPI003C7C7A05